MIVTTYTCDKCGHEQNDDKQMWEIGIALNHRGTPPSGFSRLGGAVLNETIELWCRKCVEGLRLLPTPRPKPDDPPPPPKPTLEDMIREIVHEEIVDA